MSSEYGKITFEIESVNDAPTAADATFEFALMTSGQLIDIGKYISDVDHDLQELNVTLLDVNTIGELLDGGPDEQDTSGWETPAISTAPYAVQSRTVGARPTPPPHPMPPSLHRYAVQSPDKKLTLYVTSISEAEATAIDGKRLGRVDIRYRVTDPDGATAEATITLVITDQQRKCTTGHVLQVGVRGYTCVACEPGTYEFNNLVCMEVDSLHYINNSAAVEENKRGCGAQKQHRILYNEHGVVEMQAGRHCHHRRRHLLTSSTSPPPCRRAAGRRSASNARACRATISPYPTARRSRPSSETSPLPK